MSALFYYWIEYKRKYETIKSNKFKILKKLERIEKNIEEAYGKHYKIRWINYNRCLNNIENLMEVSFSYEWFDSDYISSTIIMQKSDHYKIFKNTFKNYKEHINIGKNLYKEIGKEFYPIIFSLEEIQKMDLENLLETLEKIKTHIKNRVNKNLKDEIIEKYAYYIINEITIINMFSNVIYEMKKISLELEI